MAASCNDNPGTQGLPKVQIGLLEHQTKRANRFGLKIKEGSGNETMVRAAPCLYCFDVVGKVVNTQVDAIASASGQPRSEIVSKIKRHVELISKEYFSGRRPNIPFDAPLSRIAYLYSVVSINARLLEVVFDSDSELQQWFGTVYRRKGEVAICTLGGGPGTEILGLAKWIERQHFNSPMVLNPLITDKFGEWGENWLALRDQINGEITHRYGTGRMGRPVTVTGSFSSLDVENTADLAKLRLVGSRDFFIMSYLISSIFGRFENLSSFMTSLVAEVPHGSKFLFIDRAASYDKFKGPIRELSSKAGLRLAEFHTSVSNHPQDSGEQASDLGVIREELGISPRLKWNAFWVLGTKE